jgi:hypothetical protein
LKETVQQELPSIIVRAFVDNQRIAEASVELDGQVVGNTKDAIVLDPGEHELTVSVSGQAPQSQRLLVVVGEQYRAVEVHWTQPEPAASTSSPLGPRAGAARPAESRGEFRPVPVSTYLLLGAAGAGVAGFGIFGLRSTSKQDECAPECSNAEVDRIKLDSLLADVSLGVGLLALAGATITYLYRPSVTPDKAGISLELAPLNGGALGAVRIDLR